MQDDVHAWVGVEVLGDEGMSLLLLLSGPVSVSCDTPSRCGSSRTSFELLRGCAWPASCSKVTGAGIQRSEVGIGAADAVRKGRSC